MKSLFSLFTSTLIPASCICIAINCTAATNPDKPTDTKSVGDFIITLVNQTVFQVYGLKDVQIGDDNLGSTPVCVASNVQKYKISMSSDTAFKLKIKGNGSELDYLLTLKKGGIALDSWGKDGKNSGVPSDKEIERDKNTEDSGQNPECPDGAHKIEVQIPERFSKPPGTYTDTVTVTVGVL